MKYRNALIRWMVVVIAVVVLAQSSFSENVWLQPDVGNNVTIKVLKPIYDGDVDVSLLHSVWFISGQHDINEKFTLVYDMPISFFDPSNSYYESETAIGNPYLGFEMASNNGSNKTVFNLGLRLPLASEEKWYAADLGFTTDLHRFEAFIPDLLTINMGGRFLFYFEDSPMYFKIGIDGDMMIPTEDGDAELFGDYMFEFWNTTEKFDIGVGFTGRAIITEGDLSLSERTFHQIGFTGLLKFNKVSPGVSIRIPLDEPVNNVLNAIIGLKLVINLD